MVLDSPTNCPRDIKQVQNKKQSLIHNQKPVQQCNKQYIMKYCSVNSHNTSVLGVDRTYNLGKCYITCTMYKNLQVVCKSSHTSQEPPIMLGPVYLHWDGSFDSYHSFFAHLQNKLDSVELGSVEVGVTEMIGPVGSDEEKALTKAIHQCFPESTVLLCCRT